MDRDKRDLITEVNESVKELQMGIDRHCSLVSAIFEGKVDTSKPSRHSDLRSSNIRELKLKQVIQEAIEVLEQTRKSFKSKQLELLRKKLTQALTDIE